MIARRAARRAVPAEVVAVGMLTALAVGLIAGGHPGSMHTSARLDELRPLVARMAPPPAVRECLPPAIHT